MTDTSTDRVWLTPRAHHRLRTELTALLTPAPASGTGERVDQDDHRTTLTGARHGEQRTYQVPNGATIRVTLIEAVPYSHAANPSTRADTTSKPLSPAGRVEVAATQP
ncbi:hypothetical protein [Saccharothrix sp. ALI-22-I]|uniref:hypothetical protein n=1 Tax=Saccharothrix sp. ALI-22-I TaxID=1933778 RepID=UPI00117A0888|nr:hypothetical protein [Saccharothrix sp. ALI-22-I]